MIIKQALSADLIDYCFIINFITN